MYRFINMTRRGVPGWHAKFAYAREAGINHLTSGWRPQIQNSHAGQDERRGRQWNVYYENVFILLTPYEIHILHVTSSHMHQRASGCCFLFFWNFHNGFLQQRCQTHPNSTADFFATFFTQAI
jgi:hypothetical protein